MRHVSVLLAGASLALATAFAGGAAAAPTITYNFAGVVDSSDISPIVQNDTFTGTYTFDPGAPNIGDSTSGVYNALTFLSFTIHGLTYTSLGNQEIQVGNNEPYPPPDFLSQEDRYAVVSTPSRGLTGPTIPGGVIPEDFYFITLFVLRLDDVTANLFSSTALPTNITLADFTSSTVSIDWQESIADDPGITGHLTSFAAVNPNAPKGAPEPITLSLFGAGLAGAGAMRRRAKRKA